MKSLIIFIIFTNSLNEFDKKKITKFTKSIKFFLYDKIHNFIELINVDML